MTTEVSELLTASGSPDDGSGTHLRNVARPAQYCTSAITQKTVILFSHTEKRLMTPSEKTVLRKNLGPPKRQKGAEDCVLRRCLTFLPSEIL